ncbi:hypothetical protein ACI1MP_18865 [Kitasatospora griseola]|uniref:hypothetical protein n=1 Tax=Kitasatospora griseola TaxID=2064 RepID=UPI003855F576
MLRCDASPRVTGYPLGATLRLDVPGRAAADPDVRDHRRPRPPGGPPDRPRLPELHRIEQEPALRFPAVRVLDRHPTLRAPKPVGHLLTADGRRTGYVPIAP